MNVKTNEIFLQIKFIDIHWPALNVNTSIILEIFEETKIKQF